MLRSFFQAAGWTLLLVFAGHLSGAEANYFPLETGNRWVYRTLSPGLTQTLTITVGLPAAIDGRVYYSVSGYAGQRILMRRGADGNLYLRDEEMDRDVLLAAFDPARGPYDSPMHPGCPHQARAEEEQVPFVRRRGADPLPAREVRYRSGCADAGIESELYLPGLGMVRRIETSIAGSVSYELVYARAGGVTWEPETAVAFRVALASPAVHRSKPDERPLLQGSLRVSSYGEPVTLDYPTLQTYDLQLRDSRGNVLATWSADKLFPQASQRLRGPEISFNFEMPLASQSGQALPDGEYVLVAWLPADPARPFTAQVPLRLATQPE